jgi:hypothetical protein
LVDLERIGKLIGSPMSKKVFFYSCCLFFSWLYLG